MKVLIVVDKIGSAIHRLAWMVVQHNPQAKIMLLPLHPKRPDASEISAIAEALEWCDVLDVHYWKSGEKLKELYPEQFKKKPKILFHMNPYDVDNSEVNNQYDRVVVGNQSMHSVVPYSYLIPYGVDLDFFPYQDQLPEVSGKPIVNMVVARIEGKKGIAPVAKACNELGYQLRLIGRVSSVDYLNEALAAGGDNMVFIENATDEDLREEYLKAHVHVCNSIDGFESGTLPVLESMAVGLPVLTRNVGHVPDLFDGTNMVINNEEPDNVEALKTHLKEIVENRMFAEKLRESAWETVKNLSSQHHAMRVMQQYWSIFEPDRRSISVIIPVCNDQEAFSEAVAGAIKQDYPKFEIVIADSSDVPMTDAIEQIRQNHTDVPIRYLWFRNKGQYTLAEARNRAVIESDGDLIVFCDARIKMAPNALTEFAKFVVSGGWGWGKKDGVLKGFVENFSCVSRNDLIRHGMFSERMEYYGGMSQEIRTRFELNGVMFAPVDTAEAVGVSKATSKRSRRDDIRKAKLLLAKMYQKK